MCIQLLYVCMYVVMMGERALLVSLSLVRLCIAVHLVSHMTATMPAVSLVECRGVVERGCLGYLLAALSSQVAEVRTAAAHCLSRFSAHLRASSDREKPQVSRGDILPYLACNHPCTCR